MPPERRATFDNAKFWDERYSSNIELGSGAGSRGGFLEYKRELLQDLIDRLNPRSILDVGCGDIEVTRELQFDGSYTGIDMSSVVIERNRAIRPDWTFLHGDFTALTREQPLEADLVLCLDVLIHQHDPEEYRALTKALLDASRMALLVNSFDSLPRSGKLSPNVAFHEPITKTLTDLGVHTMKTMAEFRRTLIVLAEPGANPHD
jgi:SAM-dependent methyltransferase